jgi:hypothetical protein
MFSLLYELGRHACLFKCEQSEHGNDKKCQKSRYNPSTEFACCVGKVDQWGILSESTKKKHPKIALAPGRCFWNKKLCHYLKDTVFQK